MVLKVTFLFTETAEAFANTLFCQRCPSAGVLGGLDSELSTGQLAPHTQGKILLDNFQAPWLKFHNKSTKLTFPTMGRASDPVRAEDQEESSPRKTVGTVFYGSHGPKSSTCFARGRANGLSEYKGSRAEDDPGCLWMKVLGILL